MSSISEIIWNLTHTQTDQTPQIQHNLGLNCFENGHLGIQKRGPPDLEMLVMIFHAQVIESCWDGSKHIRFCDSHVLCSKMGTYLWAIPNIRHSLATHYKVWKFSILFGNFENRNFEKFYLKNIFEKRVMKNVTQKVLCSNFFENKYFFINPKVKVAPTHGLSKTPKNIENGWKLAKISPKNRRGVVN